MGSTNSMAIMVEYDSNTPHFGVKNQIKCFHNILKMKDPGVNGNQDLGTGAGNNSVDVTVKDLLLMQLEVQ